MTWVTHCSVVAGLLGSVWSGSVRACAMDSPPVAAQVTPSALLAHWERGAFMEVFVRACQDSDGDAVGDLRGLIARLDYLKDLGVTGLWLMPIQRSGDDDHGYATVGYHDVEPAYGTLADFDELVQHAHGRGIGVAIDYVINHSSARHPAFVDARKTPPSRCRDWFVWSESAPQGWDNWGKNPWYSAAARPWLIQGEPADMQATPSDGAGHCFATFGPHMPDFNLRHPPTLAYHIDSRRFWLNRGLDGHRLDAVPHMIENSATSWNDQPESRRLTKHLQGLIETYPQRYVVCEATADPRSYSDPAVRGGAFALGISQHFVGAARGQVGSVQALAEYFKSAPPLMATFVSNHDIFAGRRLWDQFKGDTAQYRLAAASHLLQPGTPFTYYGEEVGQAGIDLPGDLSLRGPMSWAAEGSGPGFTTGNAFRPAAPNLATHNAAAQQGEPGSIHSFYRAMLRLRHDRPSIARGSFEEPFAEGLELGLERRLGEERSLVLIDYGQQVADVEWRGGPRSGTPRLVYPEGGVAFWLPAQSIQVIDLR